MIFYLSIVLFIGSIIAALALMVLGKNMPFKRFMLIASVHGAFLALFLLSSLKRNGAPDTTDPDFNFLFFICSGTALSGLVWRIKVPKLLRGYFSVFILTFLLFLFSPSRLVNFLLTTRYTDTLGKTFCVKDNYFLEQQRTWKSSNEQALYKLVIKHGIFHQTVERDLDFGHPIDSIRTLEFISDSVALVRGYSVTETYVSTRTDSTDLFISLRSKQPMKIERKLIP